MTIDDADHRLRALLETGDPALDIAPLAEPELTRLLQAAEATPSALARPPVHLTRRVLSGVAAVAVVVAGAAALTVWDHARTSVTMLTAPPARDGAAVCAPVSPAWIAQSDLAFRGHVERVEDGHALLSVQHVYRGRPDRRVEVRFPDPDGSVDSSLGLSVGDDVLVAASGGTIGGCGTSGAVSAPLTRLYSEAFGD